MTDAGRDHRSCRAACLLRHSVRKGAAQLTPARRAFFEAPRFRILSFVGPKGTDGSPRGDTGPAAMVEDDDTLLLPDGRVSLQSIRAGSIASVRGNGTARITADAAQRGRRDCDGQPPRSVIFIRATAAYSQRSRALMAAALRTADDRSASLPSLGLMPEKATAGAIDGAHHARLGRWARRNFRRKFVPLSSRGSP